MKAALTKQLDPTLEEMPVDPNRHTSKHSSRRRFLRSRISSIKPSKIGRT